MARENNKKGARPPTTRLNNHVILIDLNDLLNILRFPLPLLDFGVDSLDQIFHQDKIMVSP